jgi:uncharacterized protein YjbI with pentapeptide repeats
MPNDDHIAQLNKGVAAWNTWRAQNRNIKQPDLSDADLSGAKLSGADLSGADLRLATLLSADLSEARLRGADLRNASLGGAILRRADLSGADLSGGTYLRVADFSEADLSEARLWRARLGGARLSGAILRRAELSFADLSDADLSGADLSEATLTEANLSSAQLGAAILSGASLRGAYLNRADLSGANLSGANLTVATLVDTNLTGADLTGCHIYGVSAWGLKPPKSDKQRNLIITRPDEPAVTVDNIEVAQFIYLMLNNEKIRDAIDTIGKKGVLLLGRFTSGRIAVLERLREELRKRNFMPMVFNFDKPETKGFTETVRLLCGLSRFVIVDVTNPRSAPLELQATVPECMIPFVPIVDRNEELEPFAMLRDLQHNHPDRVSPVIRYSSVDRLIEVLDAEIIAPANEVYNRLLARKAEQLRIVDV